MRFFIIKKSESEFAIVVVYVDDLNLVETPEELMKTTNYLNNEFEMKDVKLNFVLAYKLNTLFISQPTQRKS